MGKAYEKIRDMRTVMMITLAVIISIPAILAGCLMDIGDTIQGKFLQRR